MQYTWKMIINADILKYKPVRIKLIEEKTILQSQIVI
jgi:hypothetical protein